MTVLVAKKRQAHAPKNSSLIEFLLLFFTLSFSIESLNDYILSQRKMKKAKRWDLTDIVSCMLKSDWFSAWIKNVSNWNADEIFQANDRRMYCIMNIASHFPFQIWRLCYYEDGRILFFSTKKKSNERTLHLWTDKKHTPTNFNLLTLTDNKWHTYTFKMTTNTTHLIASPKKNGEQKKRESKPSKKVSLKFKEHIICRLVRGFGSFYR